MTLRSLNNPVDPYTLMNVLKQFPITLNTTIAQLSQSGTGIERIYIDDKDAMSQGSFPAILLEPGEALSTIASNKLRDGTVQIKVKYYDRWEQQATTHSSISTAAYQDLLRIQANIESGGTLAFQGKDQVTSIPVIRIADVSKFDESLPGIKAIFREMILFINVLPYGV